MGTVLLSGDYSPFRGTVLFQRSDPSEGLSPERLLIVSIVPGRLGAWRIFAGLSPLRFASAKIKACPSAERLSLLFFEEPSPAEGLSPVKLPFSKGCPSA